MSLPEEARRNREVWTKANAEYTDGSAVEAWAQEEITWGMWNVPESELALLGDVAGLDVVELEAPSDAEDHSYYVHVSVDWARRWPSEEIWVVRKRT